MSLADLQRDPRAFRDRLQIDADGRTVRLAQVMDDWQRDDFLALDAAWCELVSAEATMVSSGRAWLERPRGHSKTTDIAVMVCWALFASRRPIKGIAAAADQDQSRLLRDAIRMLCRCNPWLGQLFSITRDKITNKHTESELEIVASDAATSYGLLPDFVVCDEIVHWSNRDLWDSLLSSSAKRKHCLLLVITNAGFETEWQYETREKIRQDCDWYFSRLAEPQASWITQDRLDEQRRLLPDIAFRRLWLNEWSSGAGDALTADDIDAAVTLDGQTYDAEPGYVYCAGLDLGLTRDATALVVIGKHVGFSDEIERKPRLSSKQRMLIECGVCEMPESDYIERGEPGTGRLKLCHVAVWKPEGGRRVDIESVERTIQRLDQRFHFATLGFDPWQSQYLGERLAKQNIPAEQVPFTTVNLRSMCSTLLEAFRERNIDLFPDENLIRDLKQLRVVEKSYGVRLDSPRGPNGHGDSATALAIALHTASSITDGRPGTVEGPLVCYP